MKDHPVMWLNENLFLLEDIQKLIQNSYNL